MENSIEYRTADLGEAATLFCLGYELSCLEPGTHDRQRVFVFAEEHSDKKNNADASLTGADYKRRRPVQVNAYDFFLALKELKSRLHDEFA